MKVIYVKSCLRCPLDDVVKLNVTSCPSPAHKRSNPSSVVGAHKQSEKVEKYPSMTKYYFTAGKTNHINLNGAGANESP